MVHKLNLEDTFQYLYRFWYASKQYLKQNMRRFSSKGWPRSQRLSAIAQTMTVN